jgi:DNA-binding GntR family transcriptional regulator
VPRRGAMVAEINRKKVTALYEIYITLLIALASKVSLVWQPGQLDPLTEQLQKIKDTATGSDPDAAQKVVNAGFDLMRMAYPIVENPYLESILEDLQPAIHRAYHMALMADPTALVYSLTFFGKLFEGIVKRDVIVVEKAMNDYGDHLLSIMMDALDN